MPCEGTLSDQTQACKPTASVSSLSDAVGEAAVSGLGVAITLCGCMWPAMYADEQSCQQ